MLLFAVGIVVSVVGIIGVSTWNDWDHSWTLFAYTAMCVCGLVIMILGLGNELGKSRDYYTSQCVELGGNFVNRDGCFKIDETTGIGNRIYLPLENTLL